jgi:uncharacterized protein YbjT (DUF2867 family)
MVLVTGATGNVGTEVVAACLAAGRAVRGLTRDPRVAALQRGAEVAGGDLDRPETLLGALRGVSALFLSWIFDPAHADRDLRPILAEARRAGVERVVLMTSGAAEGGDLENAIERSQLLAEAAVRESGMAWTILRPSGFMSNALRWVPQLRSSDAVRAPFASVPIAAIDPEDIAAVAAQALSGGAHEGRIYRLTGPEALLPAEQLRVLGDVLGRTLRLEVQSDEDARVEMSRAMRPEYVQGFFRWFRDGTYDDARVLPTVEDLTGRRPGTFRRWAVTHAAAFRRQDRLTKGVRP